MADEVFVDTGYWIALTVPNDQHHKIAATWAENLVALQRRMGTTRPILLEIGNALRKPSYRSAAATLLVALESDPRLEILTLTDALYTHGLRLFHERPDKEWSLTDCVSFVVMSDRDMTDALTADEHFEQAGFRVLLRG